jgi:transposase
MTTRQTDSAAAEMGDMEQPASTWRSPDGSFGALLRTGRRRALLSQEQLAARAGLSERTVRDLEAGRVRSPRDDTVRLLADALQLSGPQRESWIAAARGMRHPHTDPGVPGAGGPARQLTGIPARPPPSARGFGVEGKPGRRRPFTGQFQAEAIELCRRENRQIGQVAQEADLIATAVRARASQAEPQARTGSDGGLTSAERRELAELRRENRRLRGDVEILKRATAIFATATHPACVHQGSPSRHLRGPIL